MSNNLIQSGISALQTGNVGRAKKLFLKQLQYFPNDPNANQLLGLVYFNLEKFPKAIELMETSLRINSNQPHVYNNLAAVLKATGKVEQAINCYKESLKLKSDYLDAYTNLIKAYITIEDYKSALFWNEKGLDKFPMNFKLLGQKASVKNHIQEHQVAIDIYQQLLIVDPNAMNIHHDLGLALRMSGRVNEAIEHYQYAMQGGLISFKLYHNLANAYSDIGNLNEAIENFKKSIKLNPGYVDAHINLNELYWEVGKKENLFNSYLIAFESEKDNAKLRFAYVKALLRVSLYDVAFNFLDGLDSNFRNDMDYYDTLSRSLNGLENPKGALKAMQYGIENMRPLSEHFINYAVLLIENDFTAKAKFYLQMVLDKEPYNQMALGYMNVCERLTSEKKEKTFNDCEQIVKEYELGVPPGFKSLEAYCSTLKDYLDKLHTGTNEPLEQTLKNGTQTRGNLFDNEHPLIQAFIIQVRKCLDDYIHSVPQLFSERERMLSAEDFIFPGSWSVKLKQQGFHVAHIHPMGRVSSAFYVQLPDDIEDDVNHQGWLQIGQPNLQLKQPLMPTRYVKPKVGKLVFFPSYMWHGTIPFNSDQTRTTIAFDMAPPIFHNKYS